MRSGRGDRQQQNSFIRAQEVLWNTKFFEEQFSALRSHIDERLNGIEKKVDGLEKRMDGFEKRMDGVEKRMEGFEKRMDATEKLIHKMGIEIEAIRDDIKMIAEGHVMLNERFDRFESQYIRHAMEMRHDVLSLYKLT